MPDSHKEILKKANAAIVQGDYEGFLKFCTEDTQWTFVGDRTLRGKEAVRQWMVTTYKEPPKFELDLMVAEGDFVVAIGEITLKDEAGKETRNAYCDVRRFRDGGWLSCRLLWLRLGWRDGSYLETVDGRRRFLISRVQYFGATAHVEFSSKKARHPGLSQSLAMWLSARRQALRNGLNYLDVNHLLLLRWCKRDKNCLPCFK